MKKIYLMRHSETLFNTMDVNQKEKGPRPECSLRRLQRAG